ncbi:PTS glucitol/sorbitol transporter subunit IIA [Oceanobacillus chungangensis]|uniref:PTS glucose transporter subunit IIABC n=1 Tax=Oceanobacillus chungangensis TaxID=1229152 RepID=A0A3D8PZU4_9BACI|nr:PTS glucitol/sorbitol transporter subunit IIA [Oceanobacillus chungangensis]RDW20689.1 PTS glucose transporter subunit IIABC [Oceanobacillus chungangensis]
MEMVKSPYLQINVTEIGEEASLMAEDGMIILFNDTVPFELKSIAVVHDNESITAELKAGDEMEIDGEAFKILHVGNKVSETMKELGHATFHFSGEDSSDMPGTVSLENKEIPQINKDSIISFIRN